MSPHSPPVKAKRNGRARSESSKAIIWSRFICLSLWRAIEQHGLNCMIGGHVNDGFRMGQTWLGLRRRDEGAVSGLSVQSIVVHGKAGALWRVVALCLESLLDQLQDLWRQPVNIYFQRRQELMARAAVIHQCLKL